MCLSTQTIGGYLDDALLLHQNPVRLLEHLNSTTSILQDLGWLINFPKSDVTQRLRTTYLGTIIETSVPALYIHPDRLLAVQSAVRNLLQHPFTLRQWQSALGLLTSVQDLTVRGRLMLRPLQTHLKQYLCQRPSVIVPLPVLLRPFLT